MVASPAWFVATVLSVLTMLLGVAVLLIVRRVSGAITEELSYGAMLLTAIITAVLAFSSRFAWRHLIPATLSPASQGTDRFAGISADAFVGWGSSLALLLMAIGTAYPGDRTIDLLIWVPLLVADQFLRQSFFDGGLPGQSFQKLERVEIKDDPEDGWTVEAFDTDDLVQQLYRVRNDEGLEVIYGSLRADLQAGQRHTVIHVGFCPPLAFMPRIEVAPYSGPSAKIKVAQALAHGTRLEVRLDQTANEDCSVLIDLAALPE